MRIRDLLDHVSGMENFRSGIRNKHLGSPALVVSNNDDAGLRIQEWSSV
jgi:hypothetical protein